MHFTKENLPTKLNETFIWVKNVPPKQNPGFMTVGYKQVFIFQLIFFKVRSHLTKDLTLP